MPGTIRDVAALARVSVATVSRVVNRNSHRVSPATRRRVLSAVRALDYRANIIAQGLKQRRTRTVALLVPDISNPFFPAIARGIEDRAQERGYAVLFCNTYENLERERAYLELLRKRMIDGLIFATVGSNTRHLRTLHEDHLPVVLVARDVAGVPIDAVLVDNFRGEFQAATHLIGLGHRRIAYIAGPASLHIAAERRRGYVTALDAAGIARDDRLLVEGDFSAEGGRKAIQRLMERGVRFTGVIAANDLMAIGAMEALKHSGRRIPEDVAVVGFDDITFASLVSPALTTVAQPKYKMGQLAMDRLLVLLESTDGGPQHIVLPPELVVRESCGAHLKSGREVGGGNR